MFKTACECAVHVCATKFVCVLQLMWECVLVW